MGWAYQGEISFGHQPVFKTLVGASRRCFVECDAQGPAGGEVKLVAEPGEEMGDGGAPPAEASSEAGQSSVRSPAAHLKP